MKKSISIVMVLLVPLWVVSGCGYGGGGSGDGGNGDGQDGNGNCITHNITTCEEGVAYWVDSCGTIEEVKEMCSCGCNAGGTDCETCTDLPCQSNSDCPTGWVCDLNTNKCKPQGCTQNADCPQGYYCDLTVNECKEVVCTPNCTGKCCGSDGCGSTCPNTCSTGYTCDPGSCLCMPYCTSNSQCGNMQCCREGTCMPAACGNMVCGYDPVCGFSCGTCPTGYACNYETGQCISDTPGDLCPTGQDCLMISDGGLLGCLIPPDMIPSSNPTCSPDLPCDGNFSCYCMDTECTESICIENCGTCPAGLTCWLLWDGGPSGCLTAEGALPADTPACDTTDYSCAGNATCYQETSTGNLICINNCSDE